MKIVKQWFTEEYNRRNGHSGTLWEAVYHDRGVKCEGRAMAACLAYIHLNPIRAAAADSFDGYAWSSYAAFCRGDGVAVAGMRYVYGVEYTCDEMHQRHEELLESLLEKEKLRRAAEILRMRAAGYDAPLDPLTTEAFLQQAARHFEEVRQEALRLREERMISESAGSRQTVLEREIVAALTLKPGSDAKDLSEVLGLHVATVYRLLQAMANKGLVTHGEHGGFWCA